MRMVLSGVPGDRGRVDSGLEIGSIWAISTGVTIRPLRPLIEAVLNF